MPVMAHPVTHENLVTYSCWFGIGIAIVIGLWMHRIAIAIPIAIPSGVDCRLFSEQNVY
jgi:hypothetical protein